MQIIDYSTFNIYDKLEDYKSLGKIAFSKSQTALIGKNEGKV